jgi:flagellar protein FlaJ
MCYRWFGRVAENVTNDKLELNLERAHLDIRAAAYLSCVWVNTIITVIISVIICLSLIIFFSLDLALSFFLIIFVVLTAIMFYFYFMKMPNMRAKARGKKIELYLPYALNFISAMSAAGVTPTEIFKSLSKQRIYGEIREEALWIYRDVELLGRDIISAMKANINRTPSEKFKEFLQGAVVTVQSGGALKPYFMGKADQYTRENRVAQRQLIESLGIMAEAYVSAVVAGVLMILVVLPVLMIISNSFNAPFLYFFIVVILPIIHIMFAWVLSSMISNV